LSPLVASFILVTMAELGGKTQFAVIALSAEYESALRAHEGIFSSRVSIKKSSGVLVGPSS